MKHRANYKTSEVGRDFNGMRLSPKNIKGWLMHNNRVVKKYDLHNTYIQYADDQKKLVDALYSEIRLVYQEGYETVWVSKSTTSKGMLTFECANAPVYGDAKNMAQVKKKVYGMYDIWLSDMLAMRSDIRFQRTKPNIIRAFPSFRETTMELFKLAICLSATKTPESFPKSGVKNIAVNNVSEIYSFRNAENLCRSCMKMGLIGTFQHTGASCSFAIIIDYSNFYPYVLGKNENIDVSKNNWIHKLNKDRLPENLMAAYNILMEPLINGNNYGNSKTVLV